MTDPFVAEIRVNGFNFAPKGWATCDGQLMPISQNTALFSLLGTMYGGDGKSTFGLPELGGQGVVHTGQLTGGDYYDQGEQVGLDAVQLQEAELPNHAHRVLGSQDPGVFSSPAPDRTFARATPGAPYQSDSTNNLVSMSTQALGTVGNASAHNNTPPVLALLFCIALQGVFPQRP